MSNKEQFFQILNDIKAKHPDLRIRLYKRFRLSDGSQGGYMDNKISMAINVKNNFGNIDWLNNILVLCHEYTHYLRDLRNQKQQEWIGVLNHNIEEKFSFNDRVWMASQIAKDEYVTNVQSLKILKKYNVKFSKRDFWQDAHSYALKIKMGPWLKQCICGSKNDGPIEFAKRSQIPYKEVYKPLTRKQYCQMLNLLKTGQLKRVGRKWK